MIAEVLVCKVRVGPETDHLANCKERFFPVHGHKSAARPKPRFRLLRPQGGERFRHLACGCRLGQTHDGIGQLTVVENPRIGRRERGPGQVVHGLTHRSRVV